MTPSTETSATQISFKRTKGRRPTPRQNCACLIPRGADVVSWCFKSGRAKQNETQVHLHGEAYYVEQPYVILQDRLVVLYSMTPNTDLLLGVDQGLSGLAKMPTSQSGARMRRRKQAWGRLGNLRQPKGSPRSAHCFSSRSWHEPYLDLQSAQNTGLYTQNKGYMSHYFGFVGPGSMIYRKSPAARQVLASVSLVHKSDACCACRKASKGQAWRQHSKTHRPSSDPLLTRASSINPPECQLLNS